MADYSDTTTTTTAATTETTQTTQTPETPEIPTTPTSTPPPLTLDLLLTRHKKELKDLTGRITQKKKNATKKTRRGVTHECEALERDLRERQEREVRELTLGGGGGGDDDDDGSTTPPPPPPPEEEIEALESSLPTLTLETNPPPPPQPHKKPNRAKARLARRAAHFDHLTTTALAEAQLAPPDPRTLELAAMHPLFAKHGLVERQIQPDGHCLYSSFADQLGWLGIPLLPPPLHLEDTTSSSGGGTAELAQYIPLRRACAAYIRAHRADFAPFLEEDLDAHVAKVEGTAEWGGHTEVVALARAYGVVVNVVQAGGVERMNDEEVGGGGGEGGKEVWLAYYRHCYGLGEHYNSLRRRRREG